MDGRPMKIWKEIPRFTQYEVSAFGAVRKIAGRCKGPVKSRIINGYRYVTLRNGDKRKVLHCARAVLMAFVGPGDLMQANHKNRDKLDNRLENLEWLTPAENISHAWKTGRKAAHNVEPEVKLDPGMVFVMRELVSTGQATQANCARAFEITDASVSLAVNFKTWR